MWGWASLLSIVVPALYIAVAFSPFGTIGVAVLFVLSAAVVRGPARSA